MQENVIHMRCSGTAPISLLFATFDIRFPLFQAAGCEKPVDESGKESRPEVFRTLKAFSTNFPHNAVDEKA